MFSLRRSSIESGHRNIGDNSQSIYRMALKSVFHGSDGDTALNQIDSQKRLKRSQRQGM